MIDSKKLRGMGLNIFPLRPESKRPVQGVSWKEYQTKEYTADIPDTCNAAVILGDTSGGIFVIDIDDDTLYKDMEDDTLTVKTGQGYHLYYKYGSLAPPTRRLDDKRGRHIDIQSIGTYVVAPGSFYRPSREDIDNGKYSTDQNRNGFTYEIIRDLPIKQYQSGRLRETLESMGFDTAAGITSMSDIERNGASQGSRNDKMFKYACYLLRVHKLYGEPLRAQMDSVNAKNTPPLSAQEMTILIESATKYEGRGAREPHPEIEAASQDIEDVPMQEIKPAHEGKPIRFSALITAVGERHTYTKSVDVQCKECNATEVATCNQFHQLQVPYCQKHRHHYTILEKTMVTDYIQALRIEEFLESARNSTPVQFDAEILGDHIGEAYIGDRKEFVAKFRSIPAKDQYNRIVFDIREMADIEQKEGCMPTAEELEKWKADTEIFDRVRDSISPELYMNPRIKETAMLAITGGSSLNGKRDNINIALLGDAQLGKSELIKFLHTAIPGSGRVIGTSVSGPGLTIGMVKLHNGQMVPKAGMLPSHTGFPVFIDECDKMKKDDLDSMLECMEQQIVSQAKAGTGAGLTLPAECPLIIGANPVNGKYNPNVGFMDNFVFDAPFISRCDIVWVIIDANDPNVDRKTREHIRNYKRNRGGFMTMQELQRYFTYVRRIRAEVPEELEDMIDTLHEEIRPRNKIDGMPVGWRQYYGIYRLVTASAALHLRETVTREDFDIVRKIINESFESIPLNGQGFIKKKGNKETVILEAWNRVCNEDGLGDRQEFIDELSKSHYFQLNAEGVWNSREAAGVFQLDNDTGRYRKVK